MQSSVWQRQSVALSCIAKARQRKASRRAAKAAQRGDLFREAKAEPGRARHSKGVCVATYSKETQRHGSAEYRIGTEWHRQATQSKSGQSRVKQTDGGK